MRIIDANVALRMIRDSKLDNPYHPSAYEATAWRVAHDCAMSCVKEAPTIDAEPVKHGRWLPQILLGERVWDCSECKTLGSPQWKRCPICEAKMDGERKET